jgi:TetR/AcrR family transcriptional regulator
MPRAKRETRPPQERILDAALQEFSRHHFEQASTNQIAKEAKVAKGLLFHYFKSKEELYLAVAQHIIDTNIRLFWDQQRDSPSDLFDRMRVWSVLRIQFAQKHPEMYHFLTMLLAECPPAIKPRAMALLAPLQKRGVEELMKDLDTSRLRRGVSIQQAIEALMLFSAGLEKKFIAIFSSMPDHGLSMIEAVSQQAHEYFELLRDGLYEPK